MRMTSQHWAAIQEHLHSKVGAEVFESWLKPLSLNGDETNTDQVVINVPTRFMRDWVVRHYADTIAAAIVDVTGKNLPVNFNVLPAAAAPRAEPAVQNVAEVAVGGKSSRTSARAPRPGARTPLPATDIASVLDNDAGNPLDPRFTFDTFVTGKSNEFAYAAAKRIAESLNVQYNPFFLYGGVGLGKTHLMHAIAWHIRHTQPQRKVLYISSEKFVYQFIRSLRDKSTIDFKEAFRSVDVLMIDDIQFIAGKEATQEEFFHTFNALINMQKQVILTADRSPHEMAEIEDRLKSRLGWGLATEIHRPDLETRLAILETKAAEMGVDLPRDVANVLADRIASNVRELEGALNRLIAHASLVNRPITLESTRDLLKDLFHAYNRTLTLDDIQKKVADFYHIKLQDMHTGRRSREVAHPRQVAMYLCKQLTSKSFPEIGKAFGGRDHTTVMHAVKAVEKRRTDDPAVAEDLRLLEGLLTGN